MRFHTAFETLLRICGWLVVLLAYPGCKSGPPPDITHPGQIIYLGYKDTYASCARCHGKDGQGGMDGPEIRDAMIKFGREKVRKFILEGKGTGDDAMPGFRKELTDQEVEQILDFLETWVQPDSLPDSTHSAIKER